MIQDIEKFKKLWNFHRGHTIDLLMTLDDSDLNFRVGDSMGTLGQQFRHLCRVDDQYITAIESGKVENNRKKLDFPLDTSISNLLTQFDLNDARLAQVLANTNDKNIKIDWSYWQEGEFSLVEHLNAMIEHEILHHGELVVYFRLMGKSFPNSWKAWGL